MRRSFTFSDDLYSEVKRTAKKKGFRSTNAYVHNVMTRDVHGEETALEDLESRMVNTVQRIEKKLQTSNNTQQVTVAFIESLALYLFQCLPEPPKEQIEANRARANLRYQKYLRAVSVNLKGNVRKFLVELAGENPAPASVQSHE